MAIHLPASVERYGEYGTSVYCDRTHYEITYYEVYPKALMVTLLSRRGIEFDFSLCIGTGTFLRSLFQKGIRPHRSTFVEHSKVDAPNHIRM